MKHRWMIVAVLLGLSFACVHELRMLPTGKLQVSLLDVGQGDAILLVSPSGRRILIDGGPDTSVLQELGAHLPFLDRRIDLVVLTHPDSDHSAGLVDVLRRYDVRQILLTGTKQDSNIYRSLLSEIAKHHIPVVLPDPERDIRFEDGLTLDVLWPLTSLFGKTVDDPNNMGVVLRALSGSSSFLLTGDAEEPAEIAILKTGQDLSAAILKVGHHGSKTSSGTGFLLAVSPDEAAISAGRKNTFGHPHAVILDRLKALGIPFRVTAVEGELRYEEG